MNDSNVPGAALVSMTEVNGEDREKSVSEYGSGSRIWLLGEG